MNEPKQENPAERISLRRLQQLALQLPPRDLEILRDLEKRRYMTSGQIARKHFTDASNDASAQRSANYVINRLQKHGLILSLTRRIGGIKGGSKGFVWSLTTSGCRLLHLDGETLPRYRAFEPSPRFVEHTLALSELDLQLRSINGITLMEIQLEPACWRDCNGVKLKPDLFAVTSDGEYEDHWFFEIDLATEAPCRIAQKCEQYEAYYRSGAEKIFPLVVWIVPDSRRKTSIQEQIAQSKTLKHKSIFTVITPDELEGLIRKGAAQ